MPSILPASDLAELPAILLLGARQSGKSQTLASWSAQFNLYKRNEAGEMMPVVNQGRVAFRSHEIAEYLVEVDRSLFRVFDVPGEVLESRRVGDPNETTGAGRMLGQLLTVKPRVAGVIAFAVPPCESGEVGCIEDRTQLIADMGKELGEIHAVEQLRSVFELIQGFVEQRLRHAGAPAPVLVVQVGFADLVVWRESDMSRLCELHNALRPGSSSEMSWLAMRSRAPVFSGLDEVARSTFAWLSRLRRAVPGVGFWCVPVSNEAVRQPNLPSHNIGASLLCMVDQIEISRQRGIRARRRTAVAVSLLVGAIVIATGLYALMARLAPEWLPASLAVSACSNVSQPEERCGCVEVLALNATDAPFRERLELISPFMAVCWRSMVDAVPPKRPRMMSLAAQFELARGAVAPSEFNAVRYEAATQGGGRPGTFPGPMPWYPAESAGQLRAVQVVQAMADGAQGVEAAKLAEGLTPAERAEFSGLLKLLAGAKGPSACLSEWNRTRESGAWKSLAAHCGREGERLPAELQPCYRADASLGYTEGAPQPSTSPCAAEGACSRGKGLETVLLRVPKPDYHTFANLAARAATPEELSQCVGRALGASHSHLLLLRLLGPGSFEDRQAIVRSAGEDQWPVVSDFLRREWVVAESGRRVGAPKGRTLPQRLPMLPLKHAVEAACALVDAPAMHAPPATPVPWREQMETDPLTTETSVTYRARAALALLTTAGNGRTPQSAGCELTAAIALRRLTEGPDHPTLLGRLNAAFQVFEAARDGPEAATTLAAAARLRCRLGPSSAPSAEIAAKFAATYRCADAAEAGTAQTGNPVAPR